jgi:Fe-S oxidoreductase
MALREYRNEMETCCRCSNCKFMPLEKIESYDHVNVCPSISRYNFHAYSGGGRMGFGIALLDRKVDFSDKLLEVVYNCQMCGACDVSCKYGMDMEVLEPLYEVRNECVKGGHTRAALDKLIVNLREEGSMEPGVRAKRGDWCKGLDVKEYTKEKAQVIFHAGCLTCFDKELWKTARSALSLLRNAGIDVGIASGKEPCCGGRAYQMGYQPEALKQAKSNQALFKKSGAEILVTGCASCYHAFKVLYDKLGLKTGLKVLHITEYLSQLIQEGRLKPRESVLSRVTYHDPCHLGRLGEPYIHWQGKQIEKHMLVYDPPRPFRRGTKGIYEPPREVIRSIPGLKLVEMDRIKEYSWCCGAGGGVKETNPGFAKWTALERIREAESTGAEALVTACPRCEANFQSAIKGSDSILKILDLVDLLDQSI